MTDQTAIKDSIDAGINYYLNNYSEFLLALIFPNKDLVIILSNTSNFLTDLFFSISLMFCKAYC